jgi:hypothetical protein
MTRIVNAPGRFLFAAALACALGFGATQAFASPAASQAAVCGPGCVYRNYQCICL